MSECSEFGLRHREGDNVPVVREAQGPAAAVSRRIASGEGTFWFLFGPSKKELARASGRKAVHLRRFASFTRWRPIPMIREEQSFRAVRAAYFCLVKSKHDSAKALANGEAGPKGECRRHESNRHRRTRADAAAPRRSPVLLA